MRHNYSPLALLLIVLLSTTHVSGNDFDKALEKALNSEAFKAIEIDNKKRRSLLNQTRAAHGDFGILPHVLNATPSAIAAQGLNSVNPSYIAGSGLGQLIERDGQIISNRYQELFNEIRKDPGNMFMPEHRPAPADFMRKNERRAVDVANNNILHLSKMLKRDAPYMSDAQLIKAIEQINGLKKQVNYYYIYYGRDPIYALVDLSKIKPSPLSSTRKSSVIERLGNRFSMLEHGMRATCNRKGQNIWKCKYASGTVANLTITPSGNTVRMERKDITSSYNATADYKGTITNSGMSGTRRWKPAGGGGNTASWSISFNR